MYYIYYLWIPDWKINNDIYINRGWCAIVPICKQEIPPEYVFRNILGKNIVPRDVCEKIYHFTRMQPSYVILLLGDDWTIHTHTHSNVYYMVVIKPTLISLKLHCSWK